MATNPNGNLPTGPELGPNLPSLRLSECLCPICMSILIEPVSMPCSHELCMPCFKQNVEEANFTCPMCRLRISNWARRAARENRLVNRKRWQEILAAFPEQCRKRLEGEDDDEDYMEEEEHPKPVVCKPGEIREEYEKEMEKVRKQRREEAEKEVQRSEEYIQRLQQEEVKRIEEARNEQEKLKREDEELARKLAEDLDKRQQLEKQAEEDERLAWKLHCEEQMIQSPRAISTVSNSSHGSGGRKLSSSSRSSSNSSIKCLRIDNFLAPTAKNTKQSPSPEIILGINTPGTSKGVVVLTPSPQSNLSFESDFSKPGPSGISQLDLNTSASEFLENSKERTLTRSPSDQSICSSESTSFRSAMSFPPLPVLDDLGVESKDEDSSDVLQKVGLEKSPRSASEPCQLKKRSSSVQSHTSTTSAPCVTTRKSSTDKEAKKDINQDRSRPKKKGAFQRYTSESKERDKQNERERSDSLSSVDSISHELNHFRPIQSSPRTARKKLADGRSESPPIIQATPRNLKDMKTPVGSESPFIDPPPLVRAKFQKLVEERHCQVEATSKGTMTSKKVQHWKKIARPEARKSNTIGASTKRKLSKFEFSSDSGFMQPAAKFQRIHPSKDSGYKQKRTVGTQKAIPMKKRQVIDFESMDTSDKFQSSVCQMDLSSNEASTESALPKKDHTNPPKVPKKVVSVSSGAKRKILMDDFVKLRKESDVPSPEATCSISNSDTSAVDQEPKSAQSSLDSVDVSSEKSSTSSDTSPSKVYKMRLKTKQNIIGSREVSIKSANTSKNSSDNIPDRTQTPIKCIKNKPNTPIREKVDGSGDTKHAAVSESDTNQSPENHRRGLRSQRLRSGTSPGKGILVETIQNGSKIDNDSVTSRQVHNLKNDHHKLRTACSPPLNHISEVIRKSESPKVKRSPRSRRKQTTSSPKVSSSPRSCKNSVSPPPPLLKGSSSVRKGHNAGIMKSPRTERKNTLWKYMELMTEEQKRMKQEEEDRRIALQLQQEFDKQEKVNRNKVVRAKGTKDAYRLRHGSSSSVP